MKHFSLAGRSQRLCTGTFMAVLLFSLLQKSILTATCEELDNKRYVFKNYFQISLLDT